MTRKGNHRQYMLDQLPTLPQIQQLLVNLSNIQRGEAAVVGVMSEGLGKNVGGVLVTTNEVKADFIVRYQLADVVVTNVNVSDFSM